MVIYKATNKVNGKIYVGQTINKLSNRRRQHENSYKYESTKDGVFARDRSQFYHHQARTLDIVNETGAGDAFMAGIIYSRLHGFNLKETCEFATAMSEIALMSEETVSPLISLENVEKILKEIKT